MASILVIDDDPQMRSFVRLILTEEGHEVREARNGSEGVKAHRLDPADLIFSDIFMPEQEGLETIRQLAAESPGLKMVAMSGGSQYLSGQEVLHIAKAFGALAVLHKPLERGTLVATVRGLLQG